MIKAPFTDQQVVSLIKFQHCDWVHPFTCCSTPMTVDNTGFHCSKCQSLQEWCHEFMTGPAPSNPLKLLPGWEEAANQNTPLLDEAICKIFVTDGEVIDQKHQAMFAPIEHKLNKVTKEAYYLKKNICMAITMLGLNNSTGLHHALEILKEALDDNPF